MWNFPSLSPVASGAALVVVTAGVSVIVVHWLLPAVLRSLIVPIEDVIGATAAMALLPEYLLTAAMRQRGRPPLGVAYDVGDVVGWFARTSRTLIRALLIGAARAARETHPAVVAVIAAGVTLAQIFD